ncbi:MAG: porin family protein [Bacteroidetes bacterium]|nr:porin family protein [Bacteroidota bacterium]
MKDKAIFTFAFLLVFLFFSFPAKSQKSIIINNPRYDDDIIHFGFVLGGNMSYLTIRPVSDMQHIVWDSTYIPDILPMPVGARVLSIESRPTPGFVISIVSDLRLGPLFNLRFIPSLSFGDRDLIYSILVYRKTDTTLMTITKKVPSTYINFPLEFKYKALRYDNFRPYLLAGVQYTIDLASQAKKREQRSSDQKIVKFNQNDLYIEAGIGFDFYNEWFKLGVELKMMYGIQDILKREHNIYTDPIAKLNSKIFQLSFTFE